MSDISMRCEHTLSPDEARENLEKLAIKLADRMGGSWKWEGDVVVCESRGASARVGYDESSISVDVTLPRAFKPFRHRLEKKIDESFDKYFREHRSD